MAYTTIEEARDRYTHLEILDYEERGDCYTWCYPLRLGPMDTRSIWQPTDIPPLTNSMTLYVHIPYCTFICSMCPFTHEVLRKADLSAYVKALIQEINFYAKHPLSKQYGVTTLYFGGGTASSLTVSMLNDILETIYDNFRLEPDCQLTLECHPRTVDQTYLEGAKTAGINRVSFGIQSFDQDNIDSLHLHQKIDLSKETIKTALDVGFNTVAFDLMYRYPNQTTSGLDRDLTTALELGAQGLSMYALDTDVRNLRTQGSQQAGFDTEMEMFYHIHNRLHESGFVQVAQPDYARPGHENWQVRDLWGAPQAMNLSFGAGAFSEAFNNHTWANIQSANPYVECINAGNIPILMGQTWSWDDALSRYPTLGVRCLSFSLVPFRETYHVDFDKIYKFELERLFQRGYIEIIDDQLIVTKKGKFFIDNISKTFFNLSNRGKSQLWATQLQKLRPDVTYSQHEALALTTNSGAWT